MLLLIDHISFATADLDADLEILQAWGYEVEFRETGLSDLENKRPHMQHFSGSLEMCLLKHPDSISVELINHGHAYPEPANVTPAFAGVTIDAGADADFLEFDGSAYRAGVNAGLGVAMYAPVTVQDTDAMRCQQVVVATTDVEASAAFWQLLGFRPASEGNNYSVLSFRAMMGGAGCELLLHRVAVAPPPTRLDSRGFNCLALFSSDAVKDRAKLAGKWQEVSELNDLHVGGKDLSIFWLRGPGGEMVEVIGLKK